MLESLPFSANILNSQKFLLEIDQKISHKRLVLDYELDYYISGNRTMIINNNQFKVNNNTLVFRKPGDRVVSYGSYNCYLLTIDFSKKKINYGNYDRDNPENTMQETSDNPLLTIIPSHFIPDRPGEYVKIFERLCNNSQRTDSDKVNNLLLNELLCLIVSDICRSTLSKYENSEETVILTKSTSYIQQNFSREITVKDLADNVNLSGSYYLKRFKEITGTTPMEYVLTTRLSYAKQLLKTSTTPIHIIAEMCGFHDAAYFSYYFKKRFGLSPNKYRKN